MSSKAIPWKSSWSIPLTELSCIVTEASKWIAITKGKSANDLSREPFKLSYYMLHP